MSIKNELWAKREELLKNAEQSVVKARDRLELKQITVSTYKNELKTPNIVIKNLKRETPESLLEHYEYY